MKQFRLDEDYIAITERRVSEESKKLLAKAMISRAILDLNKEDFSTSAREWIFRKTGQEGGLSFEDCCEALGYRPNNIRNRIFEAYNDELNRPKN